MIETKDLLRNVAIIAHVDHGKTTLIDSLLKQSHNFGEREKLAERAMDSNELEKERGITILAKCTSVEWNGYKVNIVDTPGHADFGGEVERVLSIVDGVVLLVDSAEGVMPQTKFVLSKALVLGLRPIVVINKIDRPDERISKVLDEVFDLFVSLDASDEQLDFPVVYASGRSGYAMLDLSGPKSGDLSPLFDVIIKHVAPPSVDVDGEFMFLGTILEVDNFFGRTLTGKIYSGVAKNGSAVKVLSIKGDVVERGRIARLQVFNGIKKENVESAIAGDIVRISGLPKASVSDTVCSEMTPDPLPSYPIDPPTMSVAISVSNSPFVGREGDKITSTVIRDRLMKEAEKNIAISFSESEEKDSFIIGGRGELQLGVLIETMRREGFEMSVLRPKVIFKKDEKGDTLEPIEEVVVDVDDEYSGSVVEKISARKGEMVDMRPSVGGKTRIVFYVPSRGLIGYASEFLTDTKGTGVLNRVFHSYAKYKGEIKKYRNGVMIATDTGDSVAYALFNLQDRGVLFVAPGEKVYQGMIVGEHSRDSDLPVNVLKGKQLTNMRASGSDENIKLSPPRKMTLEDMISFVDEDEMIEVTPKSLRLRKVYLDPNDRKKFAKK